MQASRQKWLDDVSTGREVQAVQVLRQASELAGTLPVAPELRLQAESAIETAFATTRILHDLQLDEQGLVAALLHRLVALGCVEPRRIEKICGRPAVELINGVMRMDVVPNLEDEMQTHQSRASAENLRRMLIAMVDDVRVVLIRLAEQLQMLRESKGADLARQTAIARETLDIFAPLANRLGVWQLKWELEDLSLRYLETAVYKQIAARLAERRVDRERFVEQFVAELETGIAKLGLQAQVSGRAKHIYSIWKKMKRKDIEFDRIFDVLAVRVLVDSVPDCYAVLGVVHGLWTPVPGEFDDYIATPKENNYQSIHSAVVGPEGRVVEVQIRTQGMHQENELGVAAHWRYKEHAKQQSNVDSKVVWLRQLLEWKDEVSDSSHLVEAFKSDAIEDRVYVFTPKGNVVDLPMGSTPLDFAYAIHTEVGHRCRGAKINGQIVPLTRALATGDRVEILTVKSGGPSRDWLSPHLGYLHTSRARARIQRWFKEENQEHNVAAGRTTLEKELHRLGIADVRFETLAHESGYKRVDEFFAAIGHGDLKVSHAVSSLRDHIKRPNEQFAEAGIGRRNIPSKPSGVRIQGVGNLLTNLASCCSPVRGDAIVGYITQGRGVTIHRQDCGNMLRIHEQRRERFIEVDWGDSTDATYPVDIQVVAYDRHGLLQDITTVFTDAKIIIAGVTLNTDKAEHIARVAMRVEVPSIERLSQILSQVSQIPNVTEVRRIAH
jgi:GTP pyrophosphokinase